MNLWPKSHLDQPGAAETMSNGAVSVETGEDESKIHRRITWLNANVFPDRNINDQALAAVQSLPVPRGLELLKDVEEKEAKIKNPSGYLKTAVQREGAGVLVAAEAGDGAEKIERRASWLNANVFQDRQIDPEAITAVKSLGSARAMELFKDLEERKDQVQNPSGYLKAAVKREPTMARAPMVMAPMARSMAFTAADPQKVQKRATWLNANVFPDRPIDQEAVMMMTSLGTARAMELFKDVEERQEQVRNPSGYLKTAAQRDGPIQQVYHSNGDDGKIHRRATWLNGNIFQDRPIDQEAIQALTTVGTARAMALYKEVEEKQEQVKNPSGYLKTAVARDGPVSGYAAPAANVHMQSEREEQSKIQKRITWLNANVFPDRPIDTEATGAMFGLGISRAFELLKEIEGKAQELRNPTGYLKTAAMREGLAPPDQGQGQAAVQSSQEDKVSRRARWLNENLFPDRPIDQEAIAAMSSLAMPRAMELFKDVEEKAAQLRNPGGYLKVAVSREGTGPGPTGGATPRSAIYAQPRQGVIPAGDKLQRRITWLNANVFGYAPLDQETREAAASVPLDRALEILKDLEGKSSTVQNPSGYVKASIKRELSGDPRKRPASIVTGPPAKRRA